MNIQHHYDDGSGGDAPSRFQIDPTLRQSIVVTPPVLELYTGVATTTTTPHYQGHNNNHLSPLLNVPLPHDEVPNPLVTTATAAPLYKEQPPVQPPSQDGSHQEKEDNTSPQAQLLLRQLQCENTLVPVTTLQQRFLMKHLAGAFAKQKIVRTEDKDKLDGIGDSRYWGETKWVVMLGKAQGAINRYFASQYQTKTKKIQELVEAANNNDSAGQKVTAAVAINRLNQEVEHLLRQLGSQEEQHVLLKQLAKGCSCMVLLPNVRPMDSNEWYLNFEYALRVAQLQFDKDGACVASNEEGSLIQGGSNNDRKRSGSTSNPGKKENKKFSPSKGTKKATATASPPKKRQHRTISTAASRQTSVAKDHNVAAEATLAVVFQELPPMLPDLS